MNIEVNPLASKSDEYIFEIKIGDYKYKDTFTDGYYKKLIDRRISPEELVKKSFEFLLERGDSESILPKFGLPTIQKYFSDYESQISQILKYYFFKLLMFLRQNF